MAIHTIIIICVFVFIGLLTIVAPIFIFKKEEENENSNTILFFLEVDLENWRIRKSNFQWNKQLVNEKFDSYFKKNIGFGWINISKFFSVLGVKNEQQWKKTIEYCMKNKKSTSFVSEFNFKFVGERKETNYLFDAKFYYISKNRINVQFKSLDKKINSNFNKWIISKSNLYNNNQKYKLFVAFGLVISKYSSSKKSSLNLISNIMKIIKIRNIGFFKSNDSVILVYQSNKLSSITKVRKKISRRLEVENSKTNFKNFYDSLTYVECENLSNEKDLMKIMTRISFGLIKSKLTHKPIYFNFNNIKFNEFEEFKMKINNMIKYVEAKKFDANIAPIKAIKDSKHAYDLYCPEFNLSDDFWNEYILKVNNFDHKIRDSFAKYILTSKQKFDRPTLLHINDYEIENLFDLIKKRKEIVYIVRQFEYRNVQEFEQILDLLKLADIQFGFYIEEFNSDNLSIISRVKPKMLVISENFNYTFLNSGIQSKLRAMDAIFITEHLGIDLIFTNISNEMKSEIKLISKKEKFYHDNHQTIY